MVGNSDGIGLAATERLLTAGWTVVGISRSDSSIRGPRYQHRVLDVCNNRYPELLEELLLDYSFDLCIYTLWKMRIQ